MLVEELWPGSLVGAGGGGVKGGGVNVQGRKGTMVLDEHGMGEGKAAGGGKRGGGRGAGGKGEGAGGAGRVVGESWADVVRQEGPGLGARAKAKPRPPAHGTADEEEGGHDTDGREDTEENVIPPAYVEPIPRIMLESRGKALEERVAKEPEYGSSARKLQRTKNLLEITREQIKEVGGGSEGRRHFSLVNSSKRLQKLQGAQKRAHEELEEVAEEQDRLDARREQGGD